MSSVNIILSRKRANDRQLILAHEGRRFEWRVGSVGSFMYARALDREISVAAASHCIDAIHDWLVAQKFTAQCRVPAPRWHAEANAVVVNWEHA